jgi:hypothetical protein
MQRIISLTSLPQNVQECLETARLRGNWDGLELPGTALDADGKWLDTLDALQLDVAQVHSILPESSSRYVAEADAAARYQIIEHLKSAMSQLATYNIDHATLDIGLARAGRSGGPSLDVQRHLIDSLIPLADQHAITLSLPLRKPAAAPGGAANSLAMQLVEAVGHSHFRLAADVFPDELHVEVDPLSLIEDCLRGLAAVRLHYEPRLGVKLSGLTIEQWRKALRMVGYSGLVVFCPHVETPDQFAVEADKLNDMLDQYWE